MTQDFINKEFFELKEINDEILRNKTIEALTMAIEKGGWTTETVKLVPVTLNWNTKCTLLEHIHTVTQMCIAGYPLVAKFYEQNGVPFRRDYVVAGALLHDIGKFLEFAMQQGVLTHSKNAFMRHPFLGAEIAEKAGIPQELIYLIAMHSFEGDKSKHTAESDYVRRLDMDVFKCTVFGLEKKGK
ncbi:HDIG domain-containing metalloprotein [Acidaminococcus timonensis]|uniref:HDIG domain-containing metalloprotein n=1 Tax=Acidaminococcus timonensis TaxID=1871002 RepID=UPI00307929A3